MPEASPFSTFHISSRMHRAPSLVAAVVALAAVMMVIAAVSQVVFAFSLTPGNIRCTLAPFLISIPQHLPRPPLPPPREENQTPAAALAYPLASPEADETTGHAHPPGLRPCFSLGSVPTSMSLTMLHSR
jgi:hypothetical protein